LHRNYPEELSERADFCRPAFFKNQGFRLIRIERERLGMNIASIFIDKEMVKE